MRIRETRTRGGGFAGYHTEERVRIVAKDDSVDPTTTVVVADDTPTHDWQPSVTPGVPGMVTAGELPPPSAPGEVIASPVAPQTRGGPTGPILAPAATAIPAAPTIPQAAPTETGGPK